MFRKKAEPPVEVPIYAVEKVKIVEVNEPRLNLSEKEYREAVSTLSAHPGFVALTQRLATQRAYLRSKLESDPKADFHFLQAGIFWCNWLRQQVQLATTKVPERRVDPMEEERRAFEEIKSTIELVGND